MAVKVLIKPTKKLMQQSLIAAALWSLSAPVFSVSLSEIDLKSGLHQPFNATILLRNFDPVEADRVGVEIANDIIQSQYNNTTYLPAPINAKLKTTSRGTVVELTSPVAIDEPFLKFAVQLSSPTGLILRQYEVLLDPPKSVYQRTKKPAFNLIAKTPKLDALEKLKASIQVTENDRAQGIELAATPTVAALRKAPEEMVQPANKAIVAIQEPVTPTTTKPYLKNAFTPRTTDTSPLEEVVAVVESAALEVQPVEKLFTTQEMNNAEFVAALDEYSMANLQRTEKQIQLDTTPSVDQISTLKPEFAALSRAPETVQPTSMYKAPEQVEPLKAVELTVEDSAFASSTADSVAKELLAYRERVRAGKTGGLSSRELVKLSAGSVNRVSNIPQE